ncbi:methyltransferase domain-containing protein [Luteolibacter ambystomatis]|uniref:Methyltransferase domain-containing protein n=1 Tax=Luteolibacter ambystomatis TaxID=2824561 RepID=A0A975G928_9BACT|nr:class I SAM-dependent methyltransferase [Luteolibacter ambystomatis]QUE51011.1 methyltransferase domain-containing protein [Luteolibacter ambystomatis]
MPNPVQDLYQANAYPAMSHPICDPAITAVAAKLAGLTVPPPSCAHILDIGCSNGHHLLALAKRWPDSRFTGIDFSGEAIREARQTAELAGIANVEFIETDLRNFDPGDTAYDFIMAHGVYCWVPPDVRQALVGFCARHLSGSGIATISYNTQPGWLHRQALVDLVNLLKTRPAAEKIGHDPAAILAWLATVPAPDTPQAAYLNSVLHDMFAKSADILSFDDFAPINQPVTFLEFVGHTHASGLRYLGESQLHANFPLSLPEGAAESLAPLAGDPLMFQQTIDTLTNRTFRSSLLCRADAPVDPRLTTATALHFAVRALHTFERIPEGARLVDHTGKEHGRFEHPLAVAFFSALADTSPETVPMQEVLERVSSIPQAQFDPTLSLPAMARLVMDAARKGLIELRIEPARFDSAIPRLPKFDHLRQLSVRRKYPLVDIYQSPCMVPDSRRTLLNAMDGTRTVDELVALGHVDNPTLDVRAWLAHLASRGLFVNQG